MCRSLATHGTTFSYTTTTDFSVAHAFNTGAAHQAGQDSTAFTISSVRFTAHLSATTLQMASPAILGGEVIRQVM